MGKAKKGWFFSWPEALQAGSARAGGKGWNLGRLDDCGFRIPAGGVLGADAYELFMTENNMLEMAIKTAREISIDNIASEETEARLADIRKKIQAGSMPRYLVDEVDAGLTRMGLQSKALAVRSSATAEDSEQASFAGIHDSYLNVKGMDAILSAIKGCYASLWTPRALAYRRKMNINDRDIKQGVVVMELASAVASGVGFTCDPHSGREDITVINANFGLGESLVGGAIEPDEYTLDYWLEITGKRTGRKQGKTVPDNKGGTRYMEDPGAAVRQVLDEDNIVRLALLVQRVFDTLGNGEKHYDIEWVFDGADFLLVQARPITALPRYTFSALRNQPDIWSNANFSDTMPMVQSTLNWSIYKRFFKLPDLPGYPVPPGLQGIRLYQGRAYANLSIQQWYLYDALGFKPSQTNEAWGGHQPEIEVPRQNPYAGITGLKRMTRLLRFIALGSKTMKSAPLAFDRVQVFCSSFLRQDISALSNTELIQKLAEIRQVHSEYYPVFMASLASSDMTRLIKALDKHFPGRGKALANGLMAGGGNITSAQQGYRLVEMAEIARQDPAARKYLSSQHLAPLDWEKELPESSPFKQALRSFIADYGHRAVYELEIINPRWREDPTYIIDVVRSTMETADLNEVRSRQKATAARAWQEVVHHIPLRRHKTIQRLVNQSIKGMEIREMAKSVLVMIGESNRIVYQEMGRRMATMGILPEPGDVYHCAWSEILSVLRGDWNGYRLSGLVEQRKERGRELDAISPPGCIVDEVPHFARAAAATTTSGQTLQGLGASSGQAAGAARLIPHPHQGAKLGRGDVLVAPTTDPGWTPLFLRASAIVVETGGAGSHGAIVAREYGIPAVVNVNGAMKLIQDGHHITVDGDAGIVILQQR